MATVVVPKQSIKRRAQQTYQTVQAFSCLPKVLKLKRVDKTTLGETRVLSERLKEILEEFNEEMQARRIVKLTVEEKKFD